MIVGNAVDIEAELRSSQVSGTVLTLDSLIDPDGNELANSETLTFGTGCDANKAVYTWQSQESALVGRYTFIIKAVNGSYSSFAEGFFYLEARYSE